MSTFYQKLVEANRRAKNTGRLCYVYEVDGEYRLTHTHRRDWLYRVYPGGRRELSVRGAKVVKP